MQISHLLVKDWLNRLNGMGFGVQHFPAYVRRTEALHTHDVVELNYVVSGSGTHHLGSRAYPTGPGSLGIVHYTQPHDIDTGGEPMSVINLYLDLARFQLPDLGEELSKPLYRILPMDPSLRHQRNQFVHLQFTPGGEQEAHLHAMLAEQERAEPGYREAMRSQLRLFLIACARQALRQDAYPLLADAADGGERELRMEELRRSLDADPAQAVSLADLAERFGCSKPHLCRAFKRHAGTSILGYLLRQRINAAMVALRSSRDSVLQVAIDCGFADQSFFNRKFRALVGMTPTDYRERAGAGL